MNSDIFKDAEDPGEEMCGLFNFETSCGSFEIFWKLSGFSSIPGARHGTHLTDTLVVSQKTYLSVFLVRPIAKRLN